MSIYYQDEYVQLFLGDCLTEHREWLEADVLVTDPPYGIDWDGMGTYSTPGRKYENRRINGAQNPIANDSDTGARDEVLRSWGKRPAIVFGTWRKPRPTGTNHRLVWWKRGQQPGATRAPFVSQDEEIYILGDGWPKGDKPMRSVIATDEIRHFYVSGIGHPTPKPVSLMEQLIAKCPPGTIADPFAGSGSTLVAARNLGRKAVGVELEERYCEIIARRLSQGAFDFSALEATP